MSQRSGHPVAWLCAAALVTAAATAAMVNSSEAALFGKATTGVARSCIEYKGTACEVVLPERPDRTFKVNAPNGAHRGTRILVRYRDNAAVPDSVDERYAALALLTIGLCLVGAFLATATARLRAHQSPAAKALAIAVPVIFVSCILTTCASGFAHL
jgi:hypothetical protein